MEIGLVKSLLDIIEKVKLLICSAIRSIFKGLILFSTASK